MVRYFIKKSTGFDIGEKKTVEQIKNAHIKFLELYKNTDISKIIGKYKEIYNYNKETGCIKIDNLQDYNNRLSKLQQLIKNTLVEINRNDSIDKKEELIILIKTEIDSNIIKVNRFKNLENYENTIVFNETSKIELEYIKETCIQINNQLTLLERKINNLNDTSGYLTFDDFVLFDINKIKNLLKEINDFHNEIEEIKK